MQQVRHLGAAVERQPTICADDRGSRVRLQWGDGDASVDVPAAHHDVGVAEQPWLHRVGRGHRDVVAVLLEQHRRTLGKCLLGIDHRRERLVVDHHQIGGITCLHRRLGDDSGDGLTDEAHLALGQRRTSEVVVHLDHPVVRANTEVGGGEHGHHTGHRPRLLRVHFEQARVRHLGSDEHDVQRVVQ